MNESYVGAWCSHPSISNPLNASASTEASVPDAGRSTVISFSLRSGRRLPRHRILPHPLRNETRNSFADVRGTQAPRSLQDAGDSGIHTFVGTRCLAMSGVARFGSE